MNKGKHLGTEAERVLAYLEDYEKSLERKMIVSRLDFLVKEKNIVESEEIDGLLDRLFKVQENLKFSWGV